MQTRLVAASLAVALALVFAVAWAFVIPLERALVLAPALVVAAGLVAAVGVMLTRAAIESIRESRRPQMVVAAIAGLITLGVVLTLLGVELPRE